MMPDGHLPQERGFAPTGTITKDLPPLIAELERIL
jgi:hypothetical protein